MVWMKVPYTNFHNLNQDWIIRRMQDFIEEMDHIVSLSVVKYADPIQWNITTQYEQSTVVIDPATGTAYISVQPVPAGIGITNTDYWTPIFSLSELMGDINTRIDGVDTRIDGVDTRIDGIDTRIDGIDTQIGDINTDIEELDAKVGSIGGKSVKDFGAVGDGVTDDTAAFNAAIASGEDIVVPAGSYVLTNYIFTTDEHVVSNEGTYPNKPLIVTSFKMDLAPLANVEKTQLQTGSWRKQYSGMCIDASRNRIIIGNTDSGVFVLDLTTGDVVSQLNNLPEVGHSNDFAYDPEDDLIYVASYTNSNLTNISVIYASTLTFKEYKNLGYPVHTVSYDPDYKLFYVSDYNTGHIYDHDWNEIRTFNMDARTVIRNKYKIPTAEIGIDGQGTFIKDHTLYYILWIRENSAAYGSQLQSYGTALACFNGENMTVKDVYTLQQYDPYDEIESLEIYDDMALVLANTGSRSMHLHYYALDQKGAPAPQMPIRYYTGSAMYDQPTAEQANAEVMESGSWALKIGSVVIAEVSIKTISPNDNWRSAFYFREALCPAGMVAGNYRAFGYPSGTGTIPNGQAAGSNLLNNQLLTVAAVLNDSGQVSVKGGIAGQEYKLTFIYNTKA